jgi:hypothetical protein
VAYNDDGSGSFTEGDVITVCIYESGDSDYNMIGVDYTFDGVDWTTNKPFYFDPKDPESYEISAYYSGFNDSYKYDNTNHIIDQSDGLLNDPLTASVHCSARNPEATFSFKHDYSKITLNFTSAVTECKLIIGDWTTKCHLIEEGETAEALMKAEKLSDLEVQVTIDNKIYTGSIDLAELKANYNYIYNIKISDVLTVSENTSIVGFDDGGEIYADQTN